MKRLHIHIKTADLDKSVRFYTAMFGQDPTKKEADYAKWLLDDPCANVSLSTNSSNHGVDHVGVSLESKEELDEVAARLRDENVALLAEDETTCCYAKSNKYWAQDPQGAIWELFQTFGESEVYGKGPVLEVERELAPAPSAPESAPAACCG